MDDIRSQHLTAVRSIVVKLGTQLLTDKTGRLDSAFLATIATQVATLRAAGKAVTIVSSGAIGAGVGELNLPGRPTDLAKLQAVAAIGQRKLMDAWAAAFSPHNLHVAQLLLTREDVDHRTRFLNLRNTIHAVHDFGGIPVVNENDTISTDEIVEISFGDNDILAALVTHALPADLLVLLSVVDGILDAKKQPVRLVDDIDAARQLVRNEKSPLGKGGMDSKLTAARTVTGAGSAMVVADGRMPDVLTKLLAGDTVGTLFVPSAKHRAGRSRWIGVARPAGSVVVDAGAAAAVGQKNRSLLPAGILDVLGDFERGDVIDITTLEGAPVARGLTNYSSVEIRKIRGKRTADVRAELGDRAYDEVVHRDNLVIA
jgi:glutamate 5-kinase